MENSITIPLGPDRTIVLTIQEFDPDMQVDDILRIDYSNILGEIYTFPLLFNRIANLRAEQERILSLETFDLKVFESQLVETKKKSLLTEGKKGTVQEVEAAIMVDAGFIAKKKSLIETQKNRDYLESLYWSAQSKDTKLNRLSEKIRPEEFEKELVEDTINGIEIKIKRNLI